MDVDFPTRSGPIRVLLADDHETVRQGLKALFASRPGFVVLEDVSDGATAVHEAVRLSPDVVVMDLSMATHGLVALRRLKQLRPEIAVVVLSRHRDRGYVREALEAGAAGYVLKQSSFDALLDAVEAAARGQRLVDATVAGGSSLPAPPRLSVREHEVLERAAAGHANKDIALSLRISVKTVEVHKANGMQKLGLKDRSDLVRFALSQGWLTDV